MDKKVNTLVVGATYFGLGYASVHPECVIIEQSQILGGDFHSCVATADLSEIGEREENCELARSMRQEQVFEEGRFDVLKAAPALHKFVSEEAGKEYRILLDARILTIERTKSGYDVSYMDNEGVHQIFCEKILDTTVCRDTQPEAARCSSKTLNLFTVSVEAGFQQKLVAVCPNVQIEEGKNEGERIVKIPFAPEISMLDAYEELIKIWQKAFPEGEEKILFVAEEFEYHCEENSGVEALCNWNGRKYANPLTAFCAGVEYQL